MGDKLEGAAEGESRIAVDMMGGDFAPDVNIEGAIWAWENYGIKTVLVGNKATVSEKWMAKLDTAKDGIAFEHTEQIIGMDESPATALRRKPKSSMAICYNLVKEDKAQAVVSAGNTGALMAVGVYSVGTLPGIIRPAIASLIPRIGDISPVVLIDAGANIEVQSYQLVQFALMGAHYAQSIAGIQCPRVALLSNGKEKTKGTAVIREAAHILEGLKDVKYVGYIEGNDIGSDLADVIVCDGFVGNVLLKTLEGAVGLVFDNFFHYTERTLEGKIGLWLAKSAIKKVVKEKLDPSSYGGAPLLGLNCVSVVCHGSSSSKSIMNGIRVAYKFYKEDLVKHIAESLEYIEEESGGAFDDGELWRKMGKRLGANGRKLNDKGRKGVKPRPE